LMFSTQTASFVCRGDEVSARKKTGLLIILIEFMTNYGWFIITNSININI